LTANPHKVPRFTPNNGMDNASLRGVFVEAIHAFPNSWQQPGTKMDCHAPLAMTVLLWR
jgi:hypothetical protein